MKSNKLRNRVLAGVALAAFGLAAAGCNSAAASPSTSNSSKPHPKPAASVPCTVTQSMGNDAYGAPESKQYDFIDGLLLIQVQGDRPDLIPETMSSQTISSLRPLARALAAQELKTLPQACQKYSANI